MWEVVFNRLDKKEHPVLDVVKKKNYFMFICMNQ